MSDVVATGIVTWIDGARGGCFIATGARTRDLYADQTELRSCSTALYVGAEVEFCLRRGMKGRLVVANVVAKQLQATASGVGATRPTDVLPDSAVAVAVWEGEGGALV